MDLHEIDAYIQELTPHQLKILQVIYDSGHIWLTRAKISRAIGKRRLTPYDIDCLKLLDDMGMIETSTQPTHAPGSDFAYIYHMPDAVADVLQEWSEIREQEYAQLRRKPINLVNEI